jgi:cell division protein FtsQ
MAGNQNKKKKSPGRQGIRKVLWVLSWMLVAGALSVGCYDLAKYMLTSEVFAITEVKVEGFAQVPMEEYVRLAQIPEGANIFRLNTGAVEDRLRRHPWVEQAAVTRALPKTIKLTVKEREPLVAVHSPFDGQIYGIDRHRVLLPEPGDASNESATPALCFDLPIVTGLPEEKLYPGNRLSDDGSKRIIDMLLLMRTLKAGLPAQVSEIHIDRQGGLTLYPLSLVKTIYLGNENLQQRVWRLCRVWDYLEGNGLASSYIDCRFDAQGVVTRPENLSWEKWESLPPANRNLKLADLPDFAREESLR